MVKTDLQNELTKIKVELMRLLQSSVAILESVQGQNPTSWDQLKMMLKTAAESGDWNERIQNWVMTVKSSRAALGINTNFECKVSLDPNHITKKWIDVTLVKRLLPLQTCRPWLKPFRMKSHILCQNPTSMRSTRYYFHKVSRSTFTLWF